MIRLESGETSWRQYDAWRRMAELCRDQADQLDQAVRKLLERWPPYPGSASEAFGTWMAGLTASMRASADAAERARTVIDQIATTLGITQGEIARIVGQYRNYDAIEYALTPKPTPSPGQTPPPPAPAGAVPPPPGWRQALTQQARETIAAADRSVGTYASALAQFPTSLERKPLVDFDPGDLPRGSTGSFALPGMPTSPLHLPGHGSTQLPGIGIDGGPAIERPSPDPVLAGGTVVPSPTLPGTAAPPIFGSTPANGAQLPNVIVPVSTLPGAGTSPGGARPSQPNGHPTRLPTNVAPTSTGPGAPIGRSPAAHPPGMVPMAPMVPPGSARQGPVGVAPGGRAAPPGRRGRANDPDDPWAVRQGSPAVIEPATEPEDFDPGPGVIGLDR